MRRPRIWFAVACLGAATLVVTLAAILAREPAQRVAGALPTTSSVRVPVSFPASSPPPPCQQDQLTLEVEILDNPLASLRHAQGGPCLSRDLRLTVQIFTRSGRGKGLLLGPKTGFEGGVVFSRGTAEMVGFRYSPRCDERGPFVAAIRAGAYSVRERITVHPCGIEAPTG
jgi:hypothetical protein